MYRTRISKIINSGNIKQRMMLLSEEIARVKYGKDNLLTDYEFNSLNDSFQSKEEKELYNRFKEVDRIATRAIVNLQGLYFNIRLNNSDLNSYILLSHNIGQSENIVNAILSNIKDPKNRKKAADFSIDSGRLAFSTNLVDNYGYINFSMETKNNKINLLELIDTTKTSLNYNLMKFKSWKQSLTDYLDNNGFIVNTYNEMILKLTDEIKAISLYHDNIKISNEHYDWFMKYVLVN